MTSQSVPSGTATGVRISDLANLWSLSNGPQDCSGLEIITDVNDNPEQENPVTHYKWACHPILFPTEIESSTPNLKVVTDDNYRFNELYPTAGVHIEPVDWTSEPFLSGRLRLRSEAWERVKPSFNDGKLNLAVFFLELSELKQLTQTWRRGAPLLRNIANLNLAYRFGASPFLSDVSGLAEALTSFYYQWKTFFERAGKPQVRHVRIPLSPIFGDSDWNEIAPYFHWRRNVPVFKGVYTLTVKYKYNIPIPEPMARVAAFLDKIGGILNPATLWQRIPFSFVVDWFVDVDAYLRGLRIDTLPVDIVIHAATESLKWECSSKTIGRIEGVTYDVWTEQSKQYVRLPLTSQEVFSALELQRGTGINLVRAGLLASIAEVKMRSPRKWSSLAFVKKYKRAVARLESRINSGQNILKGRT